MSKTKLNHNKGSNSFRKFGTFLGVYTPSVLTILGLIMYLRFGWVVGNVGLGLTLIIVLISSSITFITALSASAIATNMKVGVGGEYYLISHSLGLELGGAIGIPLFLCRTLSITFYSFGLAESILALWPDGTFDNYTTPLVTAGIIVIIILISGKSAELALKVQIPIMVIVGLSIVALMVGVFTSQLRSPEWVATYRTAPEGFWYVFAVFFPAVTGFTAGVGMSGDLRNPRKSIPKGTLFAVMTGALVYLIIPILLSITDKISIGELAQPGVHTWSRVAILGVWLIYPGVWGAILSSAFGSALGGPRVLQALANDGLAPRLFSRISNTGQPKIATLATGVIALSAVALGGLNTVAQFVTILFLTLYVTINLSASIEKLVSDPSYRPTINVPWYLGIIGALGAVFIMFLINPYACIAAIVAELLIFMLLRKRSLTKKWGDVRAGIWIALARFAMLKHKGYGSDPRNWRPQILLFLGDIKKRINLLKMASWLNQSRGLLTASQLIVGDLRIEDMDINPIKKKMDHILEKEDIAAFGEVNIVPDFESGVIDIVQSKGIAGLKSNTIMFGWPEKTDRLQSQLRIMRANSAVRKNTIIARLVKKRKSSQNKRIVVWWRGKQKNGDLMLLLAHLLSLNEEWRDSSITLRSIVETVREKRGMKSSLSALLPAVRIQAEIEVIVRPQNISIEEVIHQKSKHADLVFLGLKDCELGEELEYSRFLQNLATGLPTTIFVKNSSEFAGRLI